MKETGDEDTINTFHGPRLRTTTCGWTDGPRRPQRGWLGQAKMTARMDGQAKATMTRRMDGWAEATTTTTTDGRVKAMTTKMDGLAKASKTRTVGEGNKDKAYG